MCSVLIAFAASDFPEQVVTYEYQMVGWACVGLVQENKYLSHCFLTDNFNVNMTVLGNN